MSVLSPEFSPLERVLRGTIALHELISAGFGDDAVADGIRDGMDHPWSQMTPTQRDTARMVSAAIKSHDPVEVPATVTAGNFAQIKWNSCCRQHRKALDKAGIKWKASSDESAACERILLEEERKMIELHIKRLEGWARNSTESAEELRIFERFLRRAAI